MKPRFSVALIGARMDYAVPRILQASEMLETFFSDYPVCNNWMYWPAMIIPKSLRPRALRSLLGRHSNDLKAQYIKAFPSFGLAYALRLRRVKNTSELIETYLWAGKRFCELIIQHGLAGSTGIYAFNSAALELLRHAHHRGLTCVLEQTSAPKMYETELLVTEEQRFPGWSKESRSLDVVRNYAEREREEWNTADVIICGSEFVRKGIAAVNGPVEKTILVPYGVDMSQRLVERKRRQKGPLRVFFAGAVGIQKGIGDLAKAAEMLGARTVSVRAAGSIALSEKGRKEVERSVKLIGRIPRTAMASEYANADVFVLPSICEGSATVCYEALAAGLPVITTPNSGSVVRDGIDGFVVPIRSPSRIAEKLELLASDRQLRCHLSRNALDRAREYTLRKYQERLMSALLTAVGLGQRSKL